MALALSAAGSGRQDPACTGSSFAAAVLEHCHHREEAILREGRRLILPGEFVLAAHQVGATPLVRLCRSGMLL